MTRLTCAVLALLLAATGAYAQKPDRNAGLPYTPTAADLRADQRQHEADVAWQRYMLCRASLQPAGSCAGIVLTRR